MAKSPNHQIESMKPVGRYALGVLWADRHDSIFPFDHLRRSCPCEVCVAAGPEAPAPPDAARKLESVQQFGEDAVMLHWGDGHETLYLTEELRDLCACAACKGEPDYPITGA